MASKPAAQTARVNGLDLTYYEWGDPDSPALVCLHSHTSSADSWVEFAEYASSKYHVFALDQRGHGDSEWASDGYARDRFVEDLREFVESLGLDRLTLVGCSMGGWHSLLYAHAHPGRVAKIVMVDIGPEPSSERLAAPPAPPAPMEFDSLEEGFRWLRTGNPHATDGRLMQDAEARLRRREDGTWTWKADLLGFDSPLPDMTDPSLIGRYWAAVEEIGCPILEVRGAESGLVSDETIERMGAIGQEISSVDVPGAGHVVMVDKPEAFIDAVTDFLGL